MQLRCFIRITSCFLTFYTRTEALLFSRSTYHWKTIMGTHFFRIVNLAQTKRRSKGMLRIRFHSYCLAFTKQVRCVAGTICLLSRLLVDFYINTANSTNNVPYWSQSKSSNSRIRGVRYQIRCRGKLAGLPQCLLPTQPVPWCLRDRALCFGGSVVRSAFVCEPGGQHRGSFQGQRHFFSPFSLPPRAARDARTLTSARRRPLPVMRARASDFKKRKSRNG